MRVIPNCLPFGRVMHPRHIVLATGVSGIPNIPDLPGLNNFAGKVVHSSGYVDGENWKGKRALVIGTGNSGHESHKISTQAVPR